MSVLMLIDRGVNVLDSTDGLTPLHLASWRGPIRVPGR